MRVYIDESGSFSIPAQPKRPAISYCGALTLPTSRLEEVTDGFRELTKGWPNEKGEIKGRLLSEEHFNFALEFYAENRLLLDAVAIDLSVHHSPAVDKHKGCTASNSAAQIPLMHHETMREELRRFDCRLRSISLPSYVQMIVMTELIENALRTNMRWFPFAAPQELSSFAWIIDGKDIAPTEMERLWVLLCLPWLQARSLNAPLLTITEGDYSHLPEEIFQQQPQPPDYLAPHIIGRPTEPFKTIDIKAIFADRRFANSWDEIGLQMADVAISAVRRAMMGTLQRSGWRRLGSLIVRPANHTQEVIGMVHIGEGPAGRWRPQPLYEKVLLTLRSEVQPVVPPQLST